MMYINIFFIFGANNLIFENLWIRLVSHAILQFILKDSIFFLLINLDTILNFRMIWNSTPSQLV